MKTRIISAIIAAVLLIAMFLIWRQQGLYVICSLAGLLSIFEYSRLTLGFDEAPLHLRWVFFALAASVFGSTITAEPIAILVCALAAVVFLLMVLMTVKRSDDLPYAIRIQSAGIVGLIYCGVFPGLAVRTLFFEQGHIWLFGLMAIVFSGDTFAYLVGRQFGKNKLLEVVSPKKTIEGAFGGLLGSAIAGVILGYFFLTHVPLWVMIILAVTTGLFAQVGDLYESLLKRVADVKDSGTIMPGHGGILDRLDGVLFAAPVYYVLVRLLV